MNKKVKDLKRVTKSKLQSKSESKRQTTRFCPKCGSTDVFWASGLPQLWSIWDCRNCGYRGVLILQDSELAEKLRKNYQKNSAKK